MQVQVSSPHCDEYYSIKTTNKDYSLMKNHLFRAYSLNYCYLNQMTNTFLLMDWVYLYQKVDVIGYYFDLHSMKMHYCYYLSFQYFHYQYLLPKCSICLSVTASLVYTVIAKAKHYSTSIAMIHPNLLIFYLQSLIALSLSSNSF